MTISAEDFKDLDAFIELAVDCMEIDNPQHAWHVLAYRHDQTKRRMWKELSSFNPFVNLNCVT